MRVWTGMCVKKCFHPFASGSNFARVSMKLCQGAYFKDDRNFCALFDHLPSSERKMTSLLLYTMTSLLLILTAFCRPPLPPTLRSSLKYPPQAQYTTCETSCLKFVGKTSDTGTSTVVRGCSRAQKSDKVTQLGHLKTSTRISVIQNSNFGLSHTNWYIWFDANCQ